MERAARTRPEAARIVSGDLHIALPLRMTLRAARATLRYLAREGRAKDRGDDTFTRAER